MPFPVPELTPNTELLLGFRFGVFFLPLGIARPNLLDIRFQKVKGLTATVRTDPLNEGGQNLHTQRLPTGIEYDNLVLERGMVVGSQLHLEVNAVLATFKFAPSNVLITLFNEHSVPVAGWLILKAYPAKWSTSDLDANEKNVVIDTLELAYTRIQPMRI